LADDLTEDAGAARGALLSQHPADRLIRELILTERDATRSEVGRIIERMATAAFPRARPHLAKRLLEGLWAEHTTEDVYLADLRRGIQSPDARLLLYTRRGGHIAAVLAGTAQALPRCHLGAQWLPLLFVVYSADRGIIVSGYQTRVLTDIAVPEGARWLR